MGKTTVEYADGELVKLKKKSKKNKNMTDGLLPFGDGDSHVETDGDHLKKKKKDKHTEKKRKIESNEDGEIDGDYRKKQRRDKKKKSESKEDGDDDQHDKGNLVSDELQKKKNKKRKRRSSEKAELKENEPGQNAEPDVEKDCDPKPEKKKTDVRKIDKKKKIDGQNLDTEKTEKSTLKTSDMGDKSKEKRKVKVKGNRVKNKTTESVENNTEKPKAKSKRVSFSGHVEVFPTSDTEREKQAIKVNGLVRGKRFTTEEDEMVKQAVFNYINVKGLGDEGLKMVLNCGSHKKMRGCWKEIAESIPHRPLEAVYLRAHVLFERCEDRSWTPEEYEILKKLQEEHGNDWKKIAPVLGKQRYHIKDAWRRIKLENLKEGKWSQEEYQNLYDLVNLDLQLKISGEMEKNSKHGMLRDNIPWSVISEKLTTRTDAICCMKWYRSLTSSLVVENKWCDADDYRMIGALYEIDATCIDDVDWDNVLEHRPGEICLKRWNQMVKHIGDYASKSFGEQVDVLAKRYCPHLTEIREEWDNKPIVP